MSAAAGLVWAAVGVWGALGIYISVTDIREGTIPGRWVWRAGFAVAALLGAVVVLDGEPLRLAWAFAVAASVGLGFEVVYRVAPEGVGYGDVRLIILNSLLVGYWGPQWAVWALCAGAVAALPQSVATLLRQRNEAHPLTEAPPADPAEHLSPAGPNAGAHPADRAEHRSPAGPTAQPASSEPAPPSLDGEPAPEASGRGHVRWGPYLVAGAAAVLAWRIAADGLAG